MHFLRESKKRIFFITNSSLRNKQMLKDRFSAFGFEAELDEVTPLPFRSTQVTSSQDNTSTRSTPISRNY